MRSAVIAAAAQFAMLHQNPGLRRPTPRPPVHRDPAASTAARTAALLALAGLALALGATVYLTDRPAGQALLIPPVALLSGRHLFGSVGDWLPSFVHPLAFSLISAVLLAPRRRWQWGACAFWFAVNAAFEIGQHPQVRGPLAAALRDGLGEGPAARALENYFLRGLFDAVELAAAALGAAAAALVLHWTLIPPEKRHARTPVPA